MPGMVGSRFWRVVVFMLLSVLPAGCAPRSEAARDPAQWVVQWHSDFHDPGPWMPGGGPGLMASYTTQGYRLAGVLPQQALWSLHPRQYAQVRMTAQMRADAAPGARGWYGLVCGFQGPDDYIALALGTDGTFAAWRATSQGLQPLEPDSGPRAHAAVRDAPQPNALVVECRKTGLRLWVNQALVFAADLPVPPGQVGMWIRTPAILPAAAWGVTVQHLGLWTWQRP